jgi:hypothetical protein
MAEAVGDILSSSHIVFDLEPVTEQQIGMSDSPATVGKERVIISIGMKP